MMNICIHEPWFVHLNDIFAGTRNLPISVLFASWSYVIMFSA